MRETMFQSTHPRRVRPGPCHTMSRRNGFQSTHPRRVRPAERDGSKGIRCFNPRTRAGCDLIPSSGIPYCVVSIHAPAQGATPFQPSQYEWRHVSIHAPAQGATCTRWLRVDPATGFNPRTRAGCDILRTPCKASTAVSIHAPAQGATRAPCEFWPSVLFQSTHPRRVRRRSSCGRSRPPSRFNPRTRAGCDQFIPPSHIIPTMFQSTHPRRVRRLSGVPFAPPKRVSIHAPAQGATVLHT